MYFGSGLIEYTVCKYFLSFCGLSFHFQDSVLWCTNFDQILFIFIFFSFVACTFGGIFKKSLLNPRSWRFTSMFPSKSFIFLAPTFRCLIYFGLCFCVWYEMQVQIYSFSCSYPVPQHHLWLSFVCVCVCDCLLN